jgi:hypothetical protein
MIAIIIIVIFIGVPVAIAKWNYERNFNKNGVEVSYKSQNVLGYYEGDIKFSHRFSIVSTTPEELKAIIEITKKELDDYVERVNKLKNAI